MSISTRYSKNRKDSTKGSSNRLISLLYILCLSLSSAYVKAQGEEVRDSLDTSTVNEYIQDHKTQLNIKFEVSNDINAFSVQENGQELTLKPNLNLRYGLVFSYKFLSVRIGFRPRVSDSDKTNQGESDTYRLRVKLLFDNWSHFLQYDYDRGFYGVNSLDYFPDAGSVKIQFPYLTSNIIFGSSLYKFNPNYSLRSIESQTEIQTRSTGSFIIGLSYNFYKLVGTDRVIQPGEELTLRYPNKDYYGVSLAAIGGYYYTWVFKKNWFLNGYARPGIGIDLNQARVNSEPTVGNTVHYQSFFAEMEYGFGAGYNGNRFFFGANLNNRLTNEKYGQDDIKIRPKKNTFNLYLGYRFKAPKQVMKPVDLIEEKVPILQH